MLDASRTRYGQRGPSLLVTAKQHTSRPRRADGQHPEIPIAGELFAEAIDQRHNGRLEALAQIYPRAIGKDARQIIEYGLMGCRHITVDIHKSRAAITLAVLRHPFLGESFIEEAFD